MRQKIEGVMMGWNLRGNVEGFGWLYGVWKVGEVKENEGEIQGRHRFFSVGVCEYFNGFHFSNVSAYLIRQPWRESLHAK